LFVLKASSPSSTTYEAGVVEFNFEIGLPMNSTQLLDMNLNKYLEIMDEAPATLDIIVFPEMTLNGMLTAVEIPEPEQNISPCDNATFAAENLLKKISCSAKTHQRYVVVDIVTKAPCPDPEMIANEDPRNCSARTDKMSYYNTNVVFDRNGTVISRYRKFNLFGESVDKPHKPQMATFETDFGVKFGHFICFDIAFKEPALELVRKHNLTDIVFTTMWFSEMPFLTAVQVQQNWAYSNNVNLLASGANNPSVGSTGSGIYAGKKGTIISDMKGSAETKLYTATVPKIKNFPQNDNYRFNRTINRYTKMEMKPLKLKVDQLLPYQMTFLNDTNGNHSLTVRNCLNGLCCDFDVEYEVKNANIAHYQYATAFYHGNRTFDGFADGNVVACAILACHNTNISSCGVRNEELETVHVWKSIEIKGDLPNTENFFYMPTSLDTSILPLEPEHFTYVATVKANEKIEIVTKLPANVDNLLTFGIYGRDFNGAASITSKITLIVIAIFAIVKLI
jgi:predicted amidohydrolase